MKDLFLKNIQKYVEDNNLQDFLEKYVIGAEERYTNEFWSQYDDLNLYLKDFKDFVKFCEMLQ